MLNVFLFLFSLPVLEAKLFCPCTQGIMYRKSSTWQYWALQWRFYGLACYVLYRRPWTYRPEEWRGVASLSHPNLRAGGSEPEERRREVAITRSESPSGGHQPSASLKSCLKDSKERRTTSCTFFNLPFRHFASFDAMHVKDFFWINHTLVYN